MNDASELTIRDVLQQIDRRLTAVEEGLRQQANAMERLGNGLRAEGNGLRAEMISGFRWIIGLMVVGWLSTMGMILPILLRS